MNKADVIVSDAFMEIIKLIMAAETDIAEKYNMGFRKYKAGVIPAWDYPEAGNCIDILMSIRDGVSHQISIIDDEIRKLEILAS